MRLLIVTQAVNSEDPVLGFFIAWIRGLATRFERVEVICLYKGIYSLPENVRVHSLGKERGRAHRVVYAARFFRLLWQLRASYDTIFVHMNQEYVLLGALAWRALRRRVVLWRNHQSGSWVTALAVRLSHVVCCTSPQAFVARYPKTVRMPIGIDTEVFAPADVSPPDRSVLFLGRLDAVKKPELFLQALSLLAREKIRFQASLCGSPTDVRAPLVAQCNALAAPLVAAGVLKISDGVVHTQTPLLYRTHALYVNLTPSGSFDKTIGEAMASGCIAVVVNQAVAEIAPDLQIPHATPEAVADALRRAFSLSDTAAHDLRVRSRSYIQQNHSLTLLIERLGAVLTLRP